MTTPAPASPPRSALFLASLTLLAAPAAAGGPPRFHVVSVEPFGSDPLSASALNDAGRVTGVVVHDVGGQSRSFPFVWSAKAGRTELQLPSGHTGASAADINAQGDVVGFLTHPSFGTRGYRWRTGSIARAATPLQVFPELQNRLPLAVSDDGRTMAGQGYAAQDPAWVFDAVTRQVTDLVVGGTVVEGVNQATAANAAGVVVGTISTRLKNGNVRPRAFRYTPGFAGWFVELLPGPASLEWYWTDASDINDAGDIVGFVFDELDQSAARWDVAGNFVDLGLASPGEFVTLAKAVNEDGWIVGWSPNDHPLGLDTPFLWVEGTFYDLNDLVDGVGNPSGLVQGAEDPGFVYRAHDVNDAGEILAEIVHFSPGLRFEDVLLVPNP